MKECETGDLALRNLHDLEVYAVQTAADCGCDYSTAVRFMRDEPSVVASELGLSTDQVIAWAERKNA